MICVQSLGSGLRLRAATLVLRSMWVLRQCGAPYRDLNNMILVLLIILVLGARSGIIITRWYRTAFV